MSQEAFKAWYAMRRAAIHEKLSAHDVLRMHGVRLQHVGERKEQISCPFHGKDADPSAKVFPSTTRGPSAVWCYVCHEQWDCIKLWEKFRGIEGYHKVLNDIEKHLGIEAPKIPDGALNYDAGGSSHRREFDELYQACEQRLRDERFVPLDKRVFDLNSYLLLGSILDKALFQVDEGKLSYQDGISVMLKVRAKVGQKAGWSPEDCLSVEAGQSKNQ